VYDYSHSLLGVSRTDGLYHEHRRITSMFQTVVVATDGSSSADRAVTMALDLAERFDAAVHALSVVDTGDVAGTPEDVREDLQTALERASTEAVETVAQRGGGIETAVREGDPADEIVEYADDVDADLLAAGTRGRHGEGRFVLGSVAEDLVRSCPVPVLTVRRLTGD
jgi:nucleotide-binding universal stress UspA family protein